MSVFFVTGTDTEVGKTFISRTIMHIYEQKRKTCVGFKPVASGCVETPSGLRNEDALSLQDASTINLRYDEVNPYAFKEAVAPHLAAQRAGRKICLKTISEAYEKLINKQADLTIVEGAGGWRLPLGEKRFMSDFVKQYDIPVVMVVGVRLGCINHACMTAEVIEQDGLKIAGWVANHVDAGMPFLTENVKTLKEHLDMPFLGEVPLVKSPKEAAHYLDVTPLLQFDMVA